MKALFLSTEYSVLGTQYSALSTFRSRFTSPHNFSPSRSAKAKSAGSDAAFPGSEAPVVQTGWNSEKPIKETDRNLLCDGQTIKQERLCVKGNDGARYGRAWPGSKKRCDEISCGAAGASDNDASCQQTGLFLYAAFPVSPDGIFNT
jgi:hypothetical protein